MSTKFCYFGVETSISMQTLQAIAKSIPDILDVEPSGIHIVTSPEEDNQPLRWFGFVADSNHRFIRQAFTEILADSLPMLVVAAHDDQNGIYLFDFYRDAKPELTLMSDGPYVGVIYGQLTVEFAQSCYSHSQLSLLSRKEENELSGAEADALLNAGNAIVIGLRQCYPNEKANHYFSIGKGLAYPINTGDDNPIDPVLTKQLQPIVNFAPEDWDWKRAQLRQRIY